MICDLIWERIKPLNELEKTLKEAYELIGKYESRRELQIILTQMGIKVKNYWLPYINMEQDSYLTQNLTTYVVGLDNTPVCICSHPRYQQYSLHRHNFYELMYVVKGTCDHVVEEHRFTLTKGEFCLVPPYVRHMVGVFSDDSFVFNILLSIEFHRDVLALLSDDMLVNYRAGKYDCIRFKLKEDDFAHFFAEQLIRHRTLETYDDNYIKANAMSLILFLFIKHVNTSQYYLSEYMQNPRISEIIFFMQTNFRTVSLNSIAAHFHYAPAYLGSLLKKNTGITFTGLLNKIRIVQACYCLNNSMDSIGVVAESVGYNNVSYFTKLFKQQLGVTPSVFRKANKSASAIYVNK